MKTEPLMPQVGVQCTGKVYWEYSAGGNIFKVFRIDFAWRGNYLNVLKQSFYSKRIVRVLILGAAIPFTIFYPLKRDKGFSFQVH
jgi:hypothetical protein